MKSKKGGAIETPMKDGFGTRPAAGSPGRYNADKGPFSQPKSKGAFEEKFYDSIRNRAPKGGAESTLKDGFGKFPNNS